MKRVSLPYPPIPPANSDAQMEYNRQVAHWMTLMKTMVENAINQNMAPCITPISVGTYTSQTSIDSTASTATTLNFVCTLATVLTNKGILSPSVNQ